MPNILAPTWSMIRSLSSKAARVKPAQVAVIVVGLGLAIAIRYPLLSFKSFDFLHATKEWYVTIRTLGFAAFATNFANYNPPYLYELYFIARFFPDTPNLLATKIPSLIGDFIGAFFIYMVVRLKYPSGPLANLATFAFLISPTVLLNSALWGQADILYTAPLVACLYFLMRRRNSLAMVAYGVALAFKLQAIFLAPLLLGLLLRRSIAWRQIILVPGVLVLAIIPAAIAGRPILDLLSIYFDQAAQYQLLQMTAATVYAWMPDFGRTQRFFTSTGVMFALSIGLVLSLLIQRTRALTRPALLLRLFLLCFLIVPFFLPRMHDRYFYPADVFAILYAFYFPRFFFVPIVVVLSSFFAYQPTLFGVETVPMAFLAIGNFTMIVVLARDALRNLVGPDFQSEPRSSRMDWGP